MIFCEVWVPRCLNLKPAKTQRNIMTLCATAVGITCQPIFVTDILILMYIYRPKQANRPMKSAYL